MPRSDAASLNALRRPIGAWLRLLWNVAPPLLHVADGEPYLAADGVHLPRAPAVDEGDESASLWYSAAAAHAAAHIVFSRRVFVREGTAPITQALIGLLEDARVEALACRELPGLRRLWARWHTVRTDDGDDFETLMLRLARGLVDPAFHDAHPWVRKGRARFYLDDEGKVLAAAHPAALRAMASALGNDIGQMRMAFNARLYRPGPSYRDDNRWMWQGGAGEQPGRAQAAPAGARVSDRPCDATPPAAMQWRYPEWDHRIGRLRPDWCTVRERHPEPSDRAPLHADPPGVQRQLVALLNKVQRGAPAWRRGEREGDEIALDDAVHFALAMRSGHATDARVYRRLAPTSHSLAIVLLIDCSASTARPHGTAAGSTQLATQQQAASALALAMTAAGCALAIQGFDSDGRNGVNHWRVKDFDAAWDEIAAGRLSGLQSGRSTRLGAALRHATCTVGAQSAERRWVLVMSDGEPHDVDIHDPHYLVEDARQAVHAARGLGVRCAGLLLDTAGAAASQRIFGSGQSAWLGDVSALPAVLARLLR